MKADPGNDHRSPPPPPAQNRSSHAAFSVGKYLASIPKWPNIWHRSRHATILSSPSKKEAAIYLWAWQTSALFGRARACGYRHNAADDNDDEDEHRNHQHPCHLEPMVGATNLAPNAPQLAAQ